MYASLEIGKSSPKYRDSRLIPSWYSSTFLGDPFHSSLKGSIRFSPNTVATWCRTDLCSSPNSSCFIWSAAWGSTGAQHKTRLCRGYRDKRRTLTMLSDLENPREILRRSLTSKSVLNGGSCHPQTMLSVACAGGCRQSSCLCLPCWPSSFLCNFARVFIWKLTRHKDI